MTKRYGNLRCTEESVPRLKALSAKLKYPTMLAFLEAVSKAPVGKLKEALKHK